MGNGVRGELKLRNPVCMKKSGWRHLNYANLPFHTHTQKKPMHLVGRVERSETRHLECFYFL
jgi:hypothetical protein